MESSVQSLEVLIGTKQDILDDDTKNEVSLFKLTATNLYAGIFYYLGQPLEQLLGNKQNLLSKNTDATMRQISCTQLTVNDSNIVSAINLKQNIIDATKDVQLRNLTCNSVDIAGTNVISSINTKQDIIQVGDLSIEQTTGLRPILDGISDGLDSLSDGLDSKQDTLGYNSNLSIKSLIVGGSFSTSIQAIGTIPDPVAIGEIQCERLVINEVLDVEEKIKEHETSISEMEQHVEEKINEQGTSISELVKLIVQMEARLLFAVPIGCIMMWSNNAQFVPPNWVRCDGTNNTPNLTGKFLKGATSAGSTGGSSTRKLTTTNLPTHSHTYSGNTGKEPNHKHFIDAMPKDDLNFSGTGSKTQEYGLVSDQGSYHTNTDTNAPGKWTSNMGGHAHTFNGTTASNGNGQSFSIEPPYYSIIYIMYKGP